MTAPSGFGAGDIFIKPALVVETAVQILQRVRVLPALITTDAMGNFGGSQNDTINIRIPAILQASNRQLRSANRALQVDDIVEYTIPVQLSDHVYQAISLQDEQRTLDIFDFASQVLQPQVKAVAYKLEDNLANLIASPNYASGAAGGTIKLDPTDPFPGIIDCRKALNDANVPDDSRILLVGSAVEANLLKSEQFRHYDKSGDDDALRRAYLGDLAGMKVFLSNAIPHDTMYVWHPTAFVYVNRAPVAAEGVVASASFAADGVALRWLADYSFTNIGNRSLVDVYTGYQVITEQDGSFVRAVQARLGISGINAGSPFGVTAAAGVQNTHQLKVVDSNGMNVTSECTFVSSAPADATVSSTGLVTGVAAGSANITVTYPDPTGGSTPWSDTLAVTVS